MSKCKTCGDTGRVQWEELTTGCCGNILPDGQCCGNGVAVPELCEDYCPDCSPTPFEEQMPKMENL